MIRKSYSILAVAMTASACAGTAARSVEATDTTRQELVDELARTSLADAVQRKDHFRPLCDGQGYPLPGNVNGKQASGTSGTSVEAFCDAIAHADPPPAPTATATVTPAPAACDRAALNQELSDQLLESALANRAQYRCLCDEAGYPLVGNINAKGTTASQFCGALREKGLL